MIIMTSLDARARYGQFANDAIVSIMLSALAKVATLAGLAVVANFYSAADIGSWLLLGSLAYLAQPLLTLRLELAVVLERDENATNMLLLVGMLCSLIVGLALIVLLQIGYWSPLGNAFSSLNMGQFWHVILGILSVMIALQTLAQAQLTRQTRFVTIGLITLMQTVLGIIIALLYAVTVAPTLVGLVVGGVASIAVSVLLMLIYMRDARIGRTFQALLRGEASDIRSIMARYAVYIRTLPAFFGSQLLSERGIWLVIFINYSASFAGIFFVARQIMMAPAAIIATSVRNVLFAHGALTSEKRITANRIDLIMACAQYLIMPGAAIIAVWVLPNLSLVFGTEWTLLGPITLWYLFPGITAILVNAVERLFDLFGRQQLGVIMITGTNVVVVLVALIGTLAGLSGLDLVVAIAIVGGALNVLVFVSALYVAKMGWTTIARTVGGQISMFAGCYGLTIAAHTWLPVAAALGVAIAIVAITATFGWKALQTIIVANRDQLRAARAPE